MNISAHTAGNGSDAATPCREPCVFILRPALRTLGVALCAGLLAAAAGCSPDDPLTDEQLGQAVSTDCSALTYQSFGAAFFARYCLGCHNEQISGDIDRTDAPNGINFNRLDGIRAFKNRIRLRAGVQGDMPPRLLPVPRPSVEDRQKLIEWIDCGAPAEADLATP